MHFKSYHQSIEVLRNRKPEPPFEDIRMLVLSTKPSRKILPFWFFISASAPILFAVYFIFSPKLTISETGRANSERLKTNNESSIIADSPSPDHAPIHHSGHRLLLSQNNNEPPPNLLTDLPNDKPAMISDQPSPKNDTAQAIASPQPPTENHQAVIESQRSAITEMQSPQIRYSIFVGASMLPRSGESFLNNTSGSIGAMMHLNNSSSLVLELRRNTFKLKNIVSTPHVLVTILKDSTGKIYHDTSSWLTSVASELLNNVFSLNVGYRLNFPVMHSFSAFIECLAGISAQGGLASQLAGLQYFITAPLSLAITLRSDQLFSRRASPQAAFGGYITMSFIW